MKRALPRGAEHTARPRGRNQNNVSKLAQEQMSVTEGAEGSRREADRTPEASAGDEASPDRERRRGLTMGARDPATLRSRDPAESWGARDSAGPVGLVSRQSWDTLNNVRDVAQKSKSLRVSVTEKLRGTDAQERTEKLRGTDAQEVTAEHQGTDAA